MTFLFFLGENNLIEENIQFQINIPDQQVDFTFQLPLSVSRNQWDSLRERPQNIYLKKYKEINGKLDELKIAVKRYINDIIKSNKKLTHGGVLTEIKRICSCQENIYDQKSLLFFAESYIKSRKSFICNTTYKRYKVFLRLIQRFEGYIGERILVENVDIDLINRFFEFGQLEEYSDSTVYRTVHFIKTILNFIERQHITTHVRQLYNIRREKYKKEVVTLSEQELFTIKKTEVPASLQAAKDWLLVSCYTGQRISDFMDFSAEKIIKVDDRSCLNFVQQKTRKEMTLPLHPAVLNVIEQNRDSFPDPIYNQKYNSDIKEVARICGLTGNITARKRIGHRCRNMEVEKWQLVTSHIGRRSFATNFYGKIPTALLMEATGHCTEQMFLKYIAVINKDRVLTLSDYFEKVYKEDNS